MTSIGVQNVTLRLQEGSEQMKMVVFGAGGFIGGWLCEELIGREDVELVPCVRRWSSAVRLARRGLKIVRVDLENAAETAAVIAGADVMST